jgi:putative flippase GtrA
MNQLTSGVRRAAGLAQVGYLLAGGVSLLLDVTTLFVLHGLLRTQLAVATTIAYVVGLLCNYWINRWWVFAGSQSHGRSALRYGLLVVFNYSATIVIVTSLTAAGLPYVIGKLIAVGGTLVWNFLAYRHWVFSPGATHTAPSPPRAR